MVKLDHLICEMLHFINSPALWKVGFASRFIVFIYSHFVFLAPNYTFSATVSCAVLGNLFNFDQSKTT